LKIRDAVVADSERLAYLINLAGEGIPEFLWQRMARAGESPLEVGARRAARQQGSFSYTNARVAVSQDVLLGMILSYRQPDPYDIGDLSQYPEVVRPLVILEARAPGSWYINAIATYPEHRGRGVASKLSEDVEARARAAGCDLLSLIVASENLAAKRLYENLGYEDVVSEPVVAYPGGPHGGEWVLMSKRILPLPRNSRD
jgi:ribosomal protein S18 acetylase RimI-like enzyme